MAVDVRLLAQAFDPAAELARFGAAFGEAGGIASFLGQVRAGGGTQCLELRHYGPLTLPGMEALARECCRRFDVQGLMILHRHGQMAPLEPIVLVAAAARHRRDALAAVDFAMDHLKSRSWFWKREKRAGRWSWIEPRDQDHADLARWG